MPGKRGGRRVFSTFLHFQSPVLTVPEQDGQAASGAPLVCPVPLTGLAQSNFPNPRIRRIPCTTTKHQAPYSGGAKGERAAKPSERPSLVRSRDVGTVTQYLHCAALCYCLTVWHTATVLYDLLLSERCLETER